MRHDLRFNMHIMVVSGHCCWVLASLMFRSRSFRNSFEVEAGGHDCICWAYREYRVRIWISGIDKSDGRGQGTAGGVEGVEDVEGEEGEEGEEGAQDMEAPEDQGRISRCDPRA